MENASIHNYSIVRHQLYHSMVELPTYVDTQTTLGTQQAEKTKIKFTSRNRRNFRSADRSKDESIEHKVKLLGKILDYKLSI